MKYKWGEKPVLLSQVRPMLVETKLADYLFNFGYFRPEIAHEQVLKKKEAWIKYQIKPNARYTIREINYPQDKLVRVVNGEVFDVAVDLREGSETYGKWFGVVLSAENKKQFFIPKGFAHGFLVLSEHAEFVYKCSDFYHPNDEGGLIWNDPDIGVEWPIPEGMELSFSDKDTKWGSFKEYRK